VVLRRLRCRCRKAGKNGHLRCRKMNPAYHRTGEIADKQVFSRPCQCRWIAVCREWQGCNGRCDTGRQHKPANGSFLDKIKTVMAVEPQPNRTKPEKGLILRIEQPFQL